MLQSNALLIIVNDGNRHILLLQIATTLAAEGVPDTIPVIAGLSNVYSHYIATNEEYAVQRYEGASTIFGPHTLSAYIQQYTMLATAMANVSRWDVLDNTHMKISHKIQESGSQV